MLVTAWSNGNSTHNGAGYGLRVSARHRDSYFKRSWSKVILELQGQSEAIEVTISPGFWTKCPELRGMALGKWLIQNGKAPWPSGHPPTARMESKGGNVFSVSL